MSEDKNRAAPDTPERTAEEMSEDEIDRNLRETFPASDPPSWTLGTDHQRETTTPEAGPPAQGKDKLPPSTV